MERSGHRGYLVSKSLMDICSQLSPPPLTLQLHGTGRRAWPDAATSVCKTHPRRGHCQLPPRAPPRPLPEACDLEPPWATVHLHLTRPKISTDPNQFPDAARKARATGQKKPACLDNGRTGRRANWDQLGP